MAYYPINLDIEGRRCLVVGGGKVAHRKASILLSFGASVVVASPEINSPLSELVHRGEIQHLSEEYNSSHLEGVFLVYGATGDEATNRRVAREAQERGILVNIVDAPELCTFIVPSVVRRGDLTISISTGGNSPALARSLREKLEEQYGSELQELTRFLGEIRRQVFARFPDPEQRKRILSCLGDIRAADFYRRGEGEFLEEAVWAYLKELDTKE